MKTKSITQKAIFKFNFEYFNHCYQALLKSIISSIVLLTFCGNLFGQTLTNLSTYPTVGIRSNSPIFTGDSLKLMATGGDTYLWSGPNNFTSSAKNITIPNTTTSNEGFYYCTVTDNTTSTILNLAVEVSIKTKSITNIIADPIICAHSDLSLSTTTGGNGAVYSWSDQNSSWTSNLAAPTFVNISPVGVHEIRCQITYNGQTYNESILVDVIDCCTQGPATLLHNEFASNITSTPLPTIFILGDLNIDVDYTFPSGSEIILAESSIVNVCENKELGINNSIIRGCEKDWMWYAFYLNDNSILKFHYNTIRDGFTSIMVDNHQYTKIELLENNFIDNNVSLGFSDVNYVDLSRYESNDFQAPTYPLPLIVNQCAAFAAITAINSTLHFPYEHRVNTFHDIKNGIYAFGSCDIEIPNPFGQFYNFNNPNYPDPQIPQGHGIYVGENSLLIKEGDNHYANFVDFYDCIEAIEVTGCDATIRNNYMENVNNGITANLCMTKTLNFLSNTIFASKNGIKLNYNDRVGPITVDLNKITLNGAANVDAMSNCILINEGGNPPSGGGFERITNNILTVDIGTNGIYCAGANETEITGNEIRLNQATYNISGIYDIGSLNSTVIGNYVYGSGHLAGNATFPFPQGLTAENTTSSLYQCNHFFNTFTGTGFYGYCYPSTFTANEFNFHSIGLYYNNTAITGDQYYRSNMWKESCAQYKAKHDGNASIYGQSRYDVSMTPVDLDPVGSVFPAFGWFFDHTGQGSYVDCSTGGGHGQSSQFAGQLSSVDTTVAGNGILYEDYTQQLQWKDGRSLLCRLNENDSLLTNNSVMQNFADSVQNQSLGMFQTVESLKKDLFYLSPLTDQFISYLSNQIMSLSDSITILDSLLLSGPSFIDSLAYLSQKEYIYNSRGILVSQKSLAIEGYYASIDENVNDVIMENGLLPSSDLIEQNEKIFNDIYLNTIAKRKLKFTGTQQRDLLNIASQCSLSGGMAVLHARSLYRLIKDTLFNDKNLCLQIGLIKSSTINPSDQKQNNFSFYPNPINDQLRISWNNPDNQVAELTLLNSIGKMILLQKFSLLGEYKDFELSNIPSGVYFVQIQTKNKMTNLGKIIVIK